MKKKNLKPIIISSLLALGFGTTSIGTSFALFTDKAETKISVTAGKVDIKPTYKSLKLYSAEAVSDTTLQDLVTDENGAKYQIVEQQSTFKNGGTALIDANGLTTVSRMTPGDKISYDVDLANESNVKIKTRFVFRAASTKENLALLEALKIKVTYGNEDAIELDHKYFYASEWKEVDPSVKTLDGAKIEVYLPIDKGNKYQNLTSSFSFGFEAVQGNAKVENEAPLSYSVDANYGLLVEEVTDEGLVVDNGENVKILKGATNSEELANPALVIPEGITDIGASAFSNVKLTSVETPSTLKHIGDQAFYSSSNTYATGDIVTLELNEGLETIGYRSFKAQPITELVLPSTLTDLGNGGFQQCSKLVGPVTIPAGVRELNSTFNECTELTGVTLNEGLVKIGDSALRHTAISTLDIPSTVKELGQQCLRDDNSLSTINLKCSEAPTIANNILTNKTGDLVINVKNENVFKALTGADNTNTDVVINNWKTSNAKVTFHYNPNI